MSKKRIAISTDDKLHISDHMGRCKYIAIYEIAGNDVVKEEFIPNNFTHVKHHSEENEEHSHDRFADALKNCNLVISRGIGIGLEQGFKSNGIDVMVVKDEGRLMQILFRYVQNQLIETSERVCKCSDE